MLNMREAILSALWMGGVHTVESLRFALLSVYSEPVSAVEIEQALSDLIRYGNVESFTEGGHMRYRRARVAEFEE
jgi:hypothetical protein